MESFLTTLFFKIPLYYKGKSKLRDFSNIPILNVSLAAFISASQSIFESCDLCVEISHSFLPTILYF